jgi:indolepyruvate ferredoxin oxidoreductase alpha subunit
VEYVQTFDPYDLEETEDALKRALQYKGTNVMISNRPCVLSPRKWRGDHVVENDRDACKRCGMCLKLGCPAIIKHEPGSDGKKFDIEVNELLCIGCDLCTQVCKFGALNPKGDGEGVAK